MARKTAVVVMAAGLGTRMKSRRAKVLHEVAGLPLVHYPVRSALELNAEKVVLVLGHQKEAVEASLAAAFPGAPLVSVLQAEQLGTAHAVLCAYEALADFDGDVIILSGDVPALPTRIIRRLLEETEGQAVGVLGMALDEPAAYGRLVRDGEGRLTRIVEARDCEPHERLIQEVNAGVYRVDARFLFETLKGLGRGNAQGEYYLTDIVAAASQRGLGVGAVVLTQAEAGLAEGVNDRLDLSRAEARVQAALRVELMRAGVTFVSPERVVLHTGVTVGPDTILGPDVALLGKTQVGAGCVLEQGVHLTDCQIDDDVTLLAYTVAERCRVESGAQVGPFARLREGTHLGPKVRVGNFVETKKAVLAAGAKANHLSYLGDVEVGEGANVGAGTITCNYDGIHKHKTRIGKGAFIGSDTQLVAPVTVGDYAYVGAGTTVTEAVPDGALAISRVRQRNLEGWGEQKRREREAHKKG